MCHVFGSPPLTELILNPSVAVCCGVAWGLSQPLHPAQSMERKFGDYPLAI